MVHLSCRLTYTFQKNNLGRTKKKKLDILNKCDADIVLLLIYEYIENNR